MNKRHKQGFCYVFLAIILCSACSMPSSSEDADSPLPSTNGVLKINGAYLFYKTLGRGAPMIVVHGGPGLDHSYLLPQIEVLAKEYQLIFYDQRACGKTSLGVDSASISVENFMHDIEGLRQKLGLDKIHLLAHSWGALLGMHYGISFSQHLNSLILLNPMSPSTAMRSLEDSIINSRTTPEDQQAMAGIMASQAFKNKESSAYEKLFRQLFRKEFYNKEYADSLTLDFPKDFAKNAEILKLLGKDLVDYNILKQLPQISCPTLIIYGDQEPLAKIAGDSLHAKIPESEYHVVKNCGHFPYIEAPKELLRIIKTFKQANASN